MGAKKSKKKKKKKKSVAKKTDMKKPPSSKDEPNGSKNVEASPSYAESQIGDPFDRLSELLSTAGWFDRRLVDRVFGNSGELPDHIKVEEFLEDDAVVVRAELPGVDPAEDIDVTVERGLLSIRARRTSNSEESTVGGYRSEFRYGSLARTLRLPDECDTDAVEASYEDGILEVKVPLTVEDESDATKIEVIRR